MTRDSRRPSDHVGPVLSACAEATADRRSSQSEGMSDGPATWREGHGWPPRHRHFGGHRVRTRFFRLIALGVFLLVVLGVSGLVSLTWTLMTRIGVSGWWLSAVPVALLLLMGGAAISGMRRFAWPLRAVMDAADRVASGDYTVRVREYGPPAIRALTRSFNTMTERLQHADRQRRDLMADLAHELRTPLSLLQGRLEGLIDGVYARDEDQLHRLLDETHVLSRLIEDLRTLALSDAGVLVLQKETVDLSTLVHDVVRSVEADAARGSVSLQVSDLAPPSMTLEIDPVRIREVLSNLLSNALRHTPAGGSVTVTINDATESVAVAVRDTGVGLTPEDLARVFDRFYKGPESRGSGLGLTIARSLVRAHGGDITASSHPGAGTTMIVALPRETDST